MLAIARAARAAPEDADGRRTVPRARADHRQPTHGCAQGTQRAPASPMLVVEQHATLAMEAAERVMFMEKGQVRFEGRGKELAGRRDLLRSVFLGRMSTTRLPTRACAATATRNCPLGPRARQTRTRDPDRGQRRMFGEQRLRRHHDGPHCRCGGRQPRHRVPVLPGPSRPHPCARARPRGATMNEPEVGLARRRRHRRRSSACWATSSPPTPRSPAWPPCGRR